MQQYALSHSCDTGSTATISLELPEGGFDWCSRDASQDAYAHLTRVQVGIATAKDPTHAIWGALLAGLKKAYGAELDGLKLRRHSLVFLPSDGQSVLQARGDTRPQPPLGGDEHLAQSQSVRSDALAFVRRCWRRSTSPQQSRAGRRHVRQ